MWKLSTALGLLGVAVDPAEDQGGVAEVELGEAVDDGLVEHVALVARLERAAERALVQVAHLPRVVTAALEALVGEVDAAAARLRDQDAAASWAGRF